LKNVFTYIGLALFYIALAVGLSALAAFILQLLVNFVFGTDFGFLRVWMAMILAGFVSKLVFSGVHTPTKGA
jgi:hypothetical protein